MGEVKVEVKVDAATHRAQAQVALLRPGAQLLKMYQVREEVVPSYNEDVALVHAAARRRAVDLDLGLAVPEVLLAVVEAHQVSSRQRMHLLPSSHGYPPENKMLLSLLLIP